MFHTNPHLGYILFMLFVFVFSTSLMAVITKSKSSIWFGLGMSVLWSFIWFAF